MDKKIAEYITACPPEKQARLKELYRIIKKQLPVETEERIAWGMPSFYLKGYVVHFSAQKHHIGFHVGREAIEQFRNELKTLPACKGSIRLSDGLPLPKELIERIVKYCVEKNSQT